MFGLVKKQKKKNFAISKQIIVCVCMYVFHWKYFYIFWTMFLSCSTVSACTCQAKVTYMTGKKLNQAWVGGAIARLKLWQFYWKQSDFYTLIRKRI